MSGLTAKKGYLFIHKTYLDVHHWPHGGDLDHSM